MTPSERRAPTAVEAAHAYARRGWAVFPCHSPRGGVCSCGAVDCASPGKHPLTRHGLHDATTRHEVIDRWWRRWPHASLALRTGKPSGMLVVDVDPAHGGDESITTLVARHGALPRTMTVHTGGGGLHLYFRHPGGEVRNASGTILGAGIDVRGDGGYVLAPPSLHAQGSRYRWASTARLAPLPQWLHERLERHHEPPPPPRTVARTDPGASSWARAALDGELSKVRHAPVGQRNHTLNRSAFLLGQIVGGGHLDRDLVSGLLLDAAAAAGLGARESRATIASGLGAGEQQPRHPKPTTQAPDLRTMDLGAPAPPAPSTRPGPAAEVTL